jgi:uncharacterized membrane protein YGL010W
MKSAQAWFDEYGESHRHPTNELLHWICVPVIVLSVFGMLASLPVPQAWTAAAPWLNWGTLTAVAALAYYFAVSVPLALAMIPLFMALYAILLWMDRFVTPVWIICLILFVLAWIGQFVGHVFEGRRPSFFKDVQFLLIGPIWLLSHVFRRAGIRY